MRHPVLNALPAAAAASAVSAALALEAREVFKAPDPNIVVVAGWHDGWNSYP